MEKVIKLKEAVVLSGSLRSQGKTVVLVGGCFDILHIGHLHFLERAKKTGDTLIVALEHDETVKRLKGADRPIHSQEHRAKILSSIGIIDHIILLPPMKTHADYFSLVENLKPTIIAATSGDPHLKQKRAQANMFGSKLKVVTKPIINNSTSRLLKILGID
ncbi:MAG: adenylyltransferase/cytidyltransferase family protein [bacterium]|nr:adenylyltransferase/cytidyltransferase family protein [bacterium]